MSWTEEHKKAVKGEYVIRIFDEDQISAYRKVCSHCKTKAHIFVFICILQFKALRNSEDISNLKSLGSVTISHPVIFTFLLSVSFSISIFYFIRDLPMAHGFPVNLLQCC